jgi:membrane protein CcdC involved in cytochrome C biogenesis
MGFSAGLTTNPKLEFYLWAFGMLIPNHCVLFVQAKTTNKGDLSSTT